MQTKDATLNKQTIYTNYANGSSYPSHNTVWFRDKLEHALVRKGDRKTPMPWNYNITSSTEWSGSATIYSGNYGNGLPNTLVEGFVGPLFNIPSESIDNFMFFGDAYQKALGKLNEKVRGGLDISVALAESHQTSQMLKSISKAEKFITGIGPRRWANHWLEFRYGWKPLLSDVYDAANELIDVTNNFTVFKARGRVHGPPRKILTSSGPIDVSNLSHYTAGPVSVQVLGETTTMIELGVVLNLKNDVARAARWSSLNPISIAWELVPYSFVVDWFIDIGSYLRDQETAWLYNTMFQSGYQSALFVGELVSTCKYTETALQYFTKCKNLAASRYQERKYFNRIILDKYPSPYLPRVNTDLSPGRLITAAALLAQFLPAPKSVKTQWMDQMRPFISYGQSKKAKFAFKPQNDWSHELKW